MKNKFPEEPRSASTPMSAPALSDEARQAVSAASDAMSSWRSETANNIERVIENMAAAARALGWPEQIVDATRTQMQTLTRMQIQMMDQMMDAWETQAKSPNPMVGYPSEMISKLQSLSGFRSTSSSPSAQALQSLPMNPAQFWTQVGEQWQKTWADAMNIWSKGGTIDPRRR
jgi:hypothetical protein